MEKENKRAIVGAKLIFPETRRIQHAGVIIQHNRIPIHQYRNFKLDHPKVNIERSYPAVTAACLLIKTKVFKEVGGFDEGYILGSYEDVDLCLKVHKRGYKIIYCPTASGYHYEKTTSRQIPDYELKIIPLNLQRFIKKWFPQVKVHNKLLSIYYYLIKRNIEILNRRINVPRYLLDIYEKLKAKFWIL